ncbi:MAG: NHLP family bacteriocin export ABC transporter peptidase/permease/ATPase subunit [Gammaproteobacteria bacterium]|nr:NHLP family bacteriocin export ABC transporter peptidase/permease/ATPase subunit [Gammaproteobacteria bacterium]
MFGTDQAGKRRVRLPVVLQMEAIECGAAALASILAYYGRHVPLEQLRHECGVSRDGTKASNILAAARRHGMKAKGFSMEPEAIAKLKPPFIVFWTFNHFLCVEGWDQRHVYLGDPALGRRRVTHAEFDEGFTGVVLVFEPGPNFECAGHRPNTMELLTSRLKGLGTGFAYVLLASLGLVIPGLLIPAFSRVFTDYFLIRGELAWGPVLLAIMLVTAGVAMAFTQLQQNGLLRFQTRFAISGAARYFWHVLRLPLGFFTHRFGGDIGGRGSLNDSVADLISGKVATVLLSLLTLLIYAVVMLQYDVVLTLLGVVFALFNLIAFALVSRRLVESHQKLVLDEGRLQGAEMRGLQLQDSFRASGTAGLFFERWAGYHTKVVNAQQRLAVTQTLLTNLPLLFAGLASAAILTVGGLRIMDGELTVGMLVAFMALMAAFLAPVTAIVGIGSELQQIQGDMLRLNDVLEQPLDPLMAAQTRVSSPPADCVGADGKLRGHVALDRVTFGYSPLGEPLIERLSIDIPQGRRVAIVGGSGSGKSTVGKLLGGLLLPTAGSIRFDGVPLAEVPHNLFRSSVAMVDQDISLFQGTVRDNITLWDDTISEHRVIEAARAAAIHEAIAERPGAYEHRVAEGGRNFSGGQRQRIEIARALVGKPSVLILDEATSALDADTERSVMDHIAREGITCIVIAHRLSAIRDCDEIVVLDHGRILERGSHDDLMARDGAYRALVES